MSAGVQSLRDISASKVHLEKKPVSTMEDLPSPLSPLSPVSPVHEGITPLSSTPVLLLSGAPAAESFVSKPPTKQSGAAVKPKDKISTWVWFRLWCTPYLLFFLFIILLNLTGMILAGVGRFPYAVNHSGAMVLGNLLFAVLMRNELLLRVLYTIAIYGLCGVCDPHSLTQSNLRNFPDKYYLVGSGELEAGSYLRIATYWRYSCGMCIVRNMVSGIQYANMEVPNQYVVGLCSRSWTLFDIALFNMNPS
jgi:hypothetical protein